VLLRDSTHRRLRQIDLRWALFDSFTPRTYPVSPVEAAKWTD